jgi:hypothetical protein
MIFLTLGQGSANVSRDGPDSKYFRLRGTTFLLFLYVNLYTAFLKAQSQFEVSIIVLYFLNKKVSLNIKFCGREMSLRVCLLEYFSISGIIWWPKCSCFENYLNLTVTYWNVLLMKVSKGNERPRLERPWPPSLCMFPSLLAKVGLILQTIGQTNLALHRQKLYTPVTQETSFPTWESSRRSRKS